MNILPKKRWHVRTKANIERVRRDEAKALEEEKEKERRVQLAEQEARTSFLRDKAQARLPTTASTSSTAIVPVNDTTAKHVNFFEDLEDGKVAGSGKNKEHEEEKKQEQEKYEKSIGLLTYLGQNSDESDGKKPWYFAPNRETKAEALKEEVSMKLKSSLDPLTSLRQIMTETPPPPKRARQHSSPITQTSSSSTKNKRDKKKKKKKKKRRKSKRPESDSSGSSESESKKRKKTVADLRNERLKREAAERKRAESLLAKMRGETVPAEKAPAAVGLPAYKQKYNSQFNPQFARQNDLP